MNEFYLISQKNISNFGVVRVFEHKNGSHAVCVDNGDNNCVFALCFDTPVLDNTGIPHILEHCVFCGSKKYPVKDAYAFLVNNVSHTYLNAITFPHKTVYAAASLDNKALALMADVCFDAAFEPLLEEGAFLQEKGVVYSEMSGLFSDIEKAAELRLSAPFYSAGLPEYIPDASYGAMLDYHKKYYTPSNCTLYIYGNIEKEPYLKMLSACFKEGYVPPKPDFSYAEKHIKIPYDCKTAVFPLCPTSDFVKTAAYEIIVSALKNACPECSLAFNADGSAAYCVVNGNADQVRKKAEYLSVSPEDIAKLKFYLQNEDFGYKPKGLFWGLKLFFAELDTNSVDIEYIFEKLQNTDFALLAKKAFSGGIYGVFEAEKKPTYRVTQTKQLEEYQKRPEKKLRLALPASAVILPKAPKIYDRLAFCPLENRGIIYMTLAFVLDMPFEILRQTGVVLQEYNTKLPETNISFEDIGKPCVLINAGFFAKDIEKAVYGLNSIFSAEKTHKKETFRPEKYTELLALSGIEKNAFILRSANEAENADIKTVQKNLFRKNNLYAAVSCHKDELSKAKYIIDALSLYSGANGADLPFKIDFSPEIKKIHSDVNTISCAFIPNGSRSAAILAAEILKNTYLWENVRNNGAYGCNCTVTPSGDLCITSFRDKNFDTTIESIKRCGDFLKTVKDPIAYKTMCKNAIYRPFGHAAENLRSLRMMNETTPDIDKVTVSELYDLLNDRPRIAALRGS